MTVLGNPLIGALNHVLGQAAWAREKLQPYAGRQARLRLPPMQVDFVVGADGRLLASTPEATPDIEIILPADTPLLLLQGSDRLKQSVRITGSAEFAEALGFVVRNLRWDIEEDLSKAVGDIAAHRIVQGLDALTSWQKQTAVKLAENLAEYFTEERPALVKPRDIEAFANDVERLRDELGRLENRMKQLERASETRDSET